MHVKKEAVPSTTHLPVSTGVTLGLSLPPSPLAEWTAHARPVKAMKPASLVKLPKRAPQTSRVATYLLTGTVDMTESMTITENETMTESITMIDPVIIEETMTGRAGVEAVLAPAAVHPLLVVTGTGAVPGTVAQGMTAGLGTAVRGSMTATAALRVKATDAQSISHETLAGSVRETDIRTDSRIDIRTDSRTDIRTGIRTGITLTPGIGAPNRHKTGTAETGMAEEIRSQLKHRLHKHVSNQGSCSRPLTHQHSACWLISASTSISIMSHHTCTHHVS